MSIPLTIIPRPITGPAGPRPTSPAKAPEAGVPRFDQILQGQLASRELKFSRHASQRMEQRGINIDPVQSKRLEQAVAQAGNKGSRDSLVLLDNLALVVSIKNNTVVTVSDRQQLQDNVFTNIDSAVIA